MELTKAANEVIVQAHMLRMSTGGSTLCVEHVLYGLLLLGRYLDEPLNKPEHEQEAKAVRALLNKSFRSIESAKRQIELDAQSSDADFRDGKTVISRATELAESRGGDMDAECILSAILESPTPTVSALMGLMRAGCAEEDAKYGSPAPQREQQPPRPQQQQQEQPPQQPQQQQQQRPQPPKEDSSLTASQIGMLLALLAAAGESERNGLKNSVHKPAGQGNRIRRHTKLGLFTYRGGTVSAAIQYFLFGLIVPFALLCGVEALWGIVTAPVTPFVGYLVNAFIVLWMFYLARGAAKLLGLISNAFGNFLEILIGCALLMGLAESAKLAYGWSVMPVWMRVIVCVFSLITVLVGIALFAHLRDQNDPTKTKIMFQNVEGTPDMAFFRYLTKALILPLLIASVIWIFNIQLAPWIEKTFWILGFLLAWNVLFTMWNCIFQRYKASKRRRGNGKFAGFMGALHLFWLLPGMVVYLHWLFDWFPMKTWVIVIVSIWCACTLLLAAVSTRSDVGIL